MSDAYDIVKKYMRMNLFKLDILSLAQYKWFQKILIGMEQLLARVHLIRTENSDVGFRLNQDLYSGFMSMLHEQKSRVQVSLEANGIPKLALPTWGLSNDITEWISYSDLELFVISFRAQTENFLFQLDKYHDWAMGRPRCMHNQDQDDLQIKSHCYPPFDKPFDSVSQYNKSPMQPDHPDIEARPSAGRDTEH